MHTSYPFLRTLSQLLDARLPTYRALVPSGVNLTGRQEKFEPHTTCPLVLKPPPTEPSPLEYRSLFRPEGGDSLVCKVYLHSTTPRWAGSRMPTHTHTDNHWYTPNPSTRQRSVRAHLVRNICVCVLWYLSICIRATTKSCFCIWKMLHLFCIRSSPVLPWSGLVCALSRSPKSL